MKKLLKLLTSIQKLHRIGANKDTKQAFKYVY
jgi:hypothetical protein